LKAKNKEPPLILEEVVGKFHLMEAVLKLPAVNKVSLSMLIMLAWIIPEFWGREEDDDDQFLSLIDLKGNIEVPDILKKDLRKRVIVTFNCKREALSFI